MGPVFPEGPRTVVTLTWLGGVLAIIGGAFWIIAAVVNPGGVVWPIFAATLSVGTLVIARSFGSRTGFWGWLAVRGFAVGLVGVIAGQMIGGNLGTRSLWPGWCSCGWPDCLLQSVCAQAAASVALALRWRSPAGS